MLLLTVTSVTFKIALIHVYATVWPTYPPVSPFIKALKCLAIIILAQRSIMSIPTQCVNMRS